MTTRGGNLGARGPGVGRPGVALRSRVQSASSSISTAAAAVAVSGNTRTSQRGPFLAAAARVGSEGRANSAASQQRTHCRPRPPRWARSRPTPAGPTPARSRTPSRVAIGLVAGVGGRDGRDPSAAWPPRVLECGSAAGIGATAAGPLMIVGVFSSVDGWRPRPDAAPGQCRDVIDRPEVQVEQPRLLVEAMVVDGHDLDPARPQRRDDVLDLLGGHGDVAVDRGPPSTDGLEVDRGGQSEPGWQDPAVLGRWAAARSGVAAGAVGAGSAARSPWPIWTGSPMACTWVHHTVGTARAGACAGRSGRSRGPAARR